MRKERKRAIKKAIKHIEKHNKKSKRSRKRVWFKMRIVPKGKKISSCMDNKLTFKEVK